MRADRQRSAPPPDPNHHVADVSTINVSDSDSTVHAMYQPGAPLVETGPIGILRIRPLPVSDPFGLAIRGNRLLLLGG